VRVENLMQRKSHLVRLGVYPDNPDLLRQWLMQEPSMNANAADHSTHYELQFGLLLETIMDTSIPKQWRVTCLDQIFQPIRNLQSRNKCEYSTEAVTRMLQLLSANRASIENELYL